MERQFDQITKSFGEWTEARNQLTVPDPLRVEIRSRYGSVPSKVLAKEYKRETGIPLGSKAKPASRGDLLQGWYGLHLRRGVQSWVAVYRALLTDSTFTVKDSNEVEMSCVLAFALYDVRDVLLSFVKETSAFCAARCFQQSETNEVSLDAILHKIGELGLPVFTKGTFGDGWVRRRCEWLMAPKRLNLSPFCQLVLRAGENVLYIKRACPKMLMRLIDAELLKHRTRITRTKPFDPEAIPELDLKPSEVRDHVKRAIDVIVSRVFGGKRFEPRESAPPVRARFGVTRKMGGALGELAGEHLLKRDSSPPDTVHFEESVLEKMIECGCGRVAEIRSAPCHANFARNFAAGVDEEVEAFGNLNRRLQAIPVPIPEPCKCRIITESESVPYQRLKQIQEFMWDTLTKKCRLPSFRFVGEPISPEGWDDTFDLQRDRWMLLEHSLVSGDFSAATDNLDPALSEYTWDAICKVTFLVNEGGGVVPLALTKWAKLGKLGLTGHRLCGYPDDPDAFVDQTWGQLMGSPMSFPILNLVNCASCAVALALNWDSDPVKLNDDSYFGPMILHCLKGYKVRSNGDDLFFVCPDSGYGIWKYVVASCGLQPSLGKNYVSKFFAVMNSEMRTIVRGVGPASPLSGDKDDGSSPSFLSWRYETFLNLPLCFGMEAKGSEAGSFVLDKTCWWDIGRLGRSNVRGILPTDPRYDARNQLFRMCFGPVLKRVPPGVSYYIPENLGGVGLPSSLQDLGQIPALPRKRASWLVCHDLKSMIKIITPPPAALGSLWDEVSKCSLPKGPVQSRLITEDPEVLLPPRLVARLQDQKCATVRLINVACDTLAEYSRDGNFDGDLEHLVKNCCIKYDDSHNLYGPITDRIRRERLFAFSISKQWKKAMASTLQPMKSKTFSSWRSPLHLEQTTFSSRLVEPAVGRDW